MSNLKTSHDYIVKAEDHNLYPYDYSEIMGGTLGCNININGVDVSIGKNSSIEIAIRTLSGGTGCYLGGKAQEGFGRNTFVSTWETRNLFPGSVNEKQIRLPLVDNGIYDFRVEWGDGTESRINTWNQVEVLHTYDVGGIYQVKITGICNGFSFRNGPNKVKITSINQWGRDFRLGSYIEYFRNANFLDVSNVTDILNTEGMVSMQGIFQNCHDLKGVKHMGKWDLSKITSLHRAFTACSLFNEDLSEWDTSSVIDMDFMFGCEISKPGVFDSNISNWDVSKVVNMSSLFFAQHFFNQDLSTKEVTVGTKTYLAWDTLNVTDMGYMFNGCKSINQNIGNWNTSKVTTFRTMFQNCNNFNQDLSTKEVTVGTKTYLAWDTLNVTNMGYMFNASITFNQNIGNWNTSKVTTFRTMFQNCNNFNQDISTKEVTVGTKLYLAWDTLNVTDMGFMFNGSITFNGNISNWNTSKVTNMFVMFIKANDFNQPINNWLISKVNFGNFGFMNSKSSANYSVENYDLLLNSWSTQIVLPNQKIDFGTIKYSVAGLAAKNVLTSAPNNWDISDGGII